MRAVSSPRRARNALQTWSDCLAIRRSRSRCSKIFGRALRAREKLIYLRQCILCITLSSCGRML